MSVKVREYSETDKGCAAYKGRRQHDQLEKPLKCSPWFFHCALGPWIATASLKESEVASQSSHAKTMGNQSELDVAAWPRRHEITSTNFVSGWQLALLSDHLNRLSCRDLRRKLSTPKIGPKDRNSPQNFRAMPLQSTKSPQWELSG